MAGYVKRIAVIKTVKHGFSTDGGELSGLIKCEAYAGFLKVEASLINFSPLSEGRYCIGLSDGSSVISFEGACFEGEADFDLSRGFAALVCFCHNGVFPVASAVCGDLTGEFAAITRRLQEAEGMQRRGESQTAFDDEAISEVNYYELEADEDGGALRADKAQKADGLAGDANAAYSGAVGTGKGAAQIPTDGERSPVGGLAGGDFYDRIKEDVKKIFSTYPREEGLERVIEGSRWARIGYGGGRYYAFGVIYDSGVARYICYAVPSADGTAPPLSLAGRASYIPVGDGGFWVMYQDAATGVSIKISAE